MAIPKPKPSDWQKANAQELQVTDREVLAMLRDAKKRVDQILKELPEGGVRRAQVESSRARLLAEQSNVFTRLGDIVAARRASSASRAARLSAASNASLLSLVGKSAQAQYLYDAALSVSQKAIDVALQRMKFSALPLSQRIYNTNVWMNGRLGKLINETLATGLNAREFAKRARDWFNPNTPGGVRYAAMRLARTEINNAFHSISAEKYATTPWITEVEWHLSGSHPKRDVCNEYAEASPYKSDEVPARPHPQCLCFITPKSIEEDDFVENFLKGDYDDYLDAELEKNGWNEPENAPVKVPVQTKEQAQANWDSSISKAKREQDALDQAAWGVDRLPRPVEFTREWRRAVNQYTGRWYSEINNLLRGQKLQQAEDRSIVEGYAAEMDAAFTATPANAQPVEVFRGISDPRSMFGKLLDNDMTGLEWSEKAYVSTTVLERRTRTFLGQNGLLLRILVPAGTRMIEGSELNAEAELILNRGGRMRVIRDNGIDGNGHRRMDVEFVNG